MKITHIDREACRIITGEVNEAITAIAKRHGLVLTLGKGAKFSGSSVTATYTVSTEVITASGGTAPSSFTRLAPSFGLSPDAFGKQFLSGGRWFEVVGINPSAHKFPIMAKCISDGKTYKFHATDVARQLK